MTSDSIPAGGPQWSVCPGCSALTYGRKLVRNWHVCPECGHHRRISADERVNQLFDPGTVHPLEAEAETRDVLGFVDSRPYPDRLERARRLTGMTEGVLAVAGEIEGRPLVAAVMDFAFLGGSLGAAAGELIALAGEEALRRRVPLLIVSASGGARMQEGVLSLMQMAKVSQVLAQLDDAGVLTVSLVTDPTYGGVAASFATQCDVIIAEPRARLGFAGRRVIEQTIGHDLPPEFQTAEFLLERGFIDMIVSRAGLRAALRRLLALASPCDGRGERPGDPVTLVRDPGLLGEIDPWEAVRQARNLNRPTTLDYLARICPDFLELHGDRLNGDCPAIVAGVASLSGRPVIVVGHQRGHSAAELARRQYGMPSPAGYRKAVRLMRLATKLGLPLVTFVDTPGAHPGLEAEENGQALAIAESIHVMGSLPVPVITVIIGEGGSGGALALAVANQVLISERGVYSVITPEGCASILWGDTAHAPRAAAALRVDARSLLEMSIVDGVVREPDGGSHTDFDEAAHRVSAALESCLCELGLVEPGALVARRRHRFRSFGSAPVTAGVAS